MFTGRVILEYDHQHNDPVFQYKYSFANKSQSQDFEHTAGSDIHNNRKLNVSWIQKKFGSMCQGSFGFT